MIATDLYTVKAFNNLHFKFLQILKFCLHCLNNLFNLLYNLFGFKKKRKREKDILQDFYIIYPYILNILLVPYSFSRKG